VQCSSVTDVAHSPLFFSSAGLNLTYLNEAHTWHARTISDLICLHPNKQNVAVGFWLPARWPWQGQPSSSVVNRRSAAAERSNPPLGSFVVSEGVRLHCVEHGNGPPVVFLHGNGVMLEDMLISRVFDQTSRSRARLCPPAPERDADRRARYVARLRSTAQVLATANVRAAIPGLRRRKQPCFRELSRSSESIGQLWSVIPGGQWSRSLWR